MEVYGRSANATLGVGSKLKECPQSHYSPVPVRDTGCLFTSCGLVPA